MKGQRAARLRRAKEKGLSIFDKKTENVDVGAVDKLAKILGAFDENLNFLSRELGIVAYVDGVKIRLEGESCLSTGLSSTGHRDYRDRHFQYL